MNLNELIKFKTALGREKDFKDIELIKRYIKQFSKVWEGNYITYSRSIDIILNYDIMYIKDLRRIIGIHLWTTKEKYENASIL